jgi:cytochrome c-type biogenesis protein CcmH
MSPFWSVSLFWIISILFVAGALVLVLPPLLRKRAGPDKLGRRDINISVYRDQLKEMEADRANGLLADDQFQTAKLELEARLAEDALVPDVASTTAASGNRRIGYGLGVLLPIAAFGIYFWLGDPTSLIDIADSQSGPDNTPAMAGAPPGHDIAKLIQKVEEKVKASPDDGEAWTMLARSYVVAERWPDALRAYEKASELLPQDASVLTGYAEALAINNNRVLAGKPMELVQQALKIEPDNIKGLELSGVNALQERKYTEASNYFKRMLTLLPPESTYAQDILAAQKEAEQMAHPGIAGLDNLSSQPPADEKTPSMASGATIKGSVDIAPALKSRLAASDVLFLFARAGQGGPPVAAIRASAGQLPMQFELNDSMAMNPANTLSQHQQVALVARVSKSGSPMGQAGDLEGTAPAVKVGAAGVKIVIDQVKP